MLPNIQLQLSAIIPMLLICFFAMNNKGIVLKNARIYRQLLLVTLMCIVADIVSVVAIVSAPPAVAEPFCRIYLMLTIWTACITVYYLGCDVRQFRNNPWRRRTFTCVNLALSSLVLVLPIEIYNQDDVVYTFGPAVTYTFGLSAVFIIAAFVLTFAFRSQINLRRRRIIRLWMLLETLGALIQYSNRRMLLVSYTMAVGVVILYVAIENPEGSLDRSTGEYSFQMLRDYLRELYETRQGCALVLVSTESVRREDPRQEALLLEVAGFLKTACGGRLFRGYGNDFIMSFPNREAAEAALPAIRGRFKEKWLGDWMVRPDIYVIPDIGFVQSVEEMLMLYHYCFTNGMQSDADVMVVDEKVFQQFVQFRDVQREIIDALNEDRVEVYLQPIYALAEGRFVSAEALARIRERSGGIVPPGVFIPIAEKSELIEAIGERVFEKVCQWIRDNSLEALGLRYIEVNLSIAQCENDQLSDRYSEMIERYGIPPSAINLEITESGQMRKRQVLLGNMAKLSDLGCSFSLDDFGTGESNLNYIVEMPVETVKFDRTMILSFFSNDRARMMMEYVTSMIKGMGMSIVAEGVEEAEQLHALEQLGVDYIQGFYFAKPMPMDAFRAFIEENNNR